MAKGKAALAFAAGFGGGYLGAKRQAELDEERKEDRAMRKDEHQARLAERQRVERDRIALSDALAPAKVEEGAGGALRPATMDDRDVGQPGEAPVTLGAAYRVNGRSFADREQAQQAAQAHDAPDAQVGRAAQVLMRSDPAKAISLQNADLTQRRTQFQFTKEQQEYAKKLQDEGAQATGRAMLSGDPQAVFSTFNAQGTFKLKEPPTVKEAGAIEIPGVGKRSVYEYTGTLVGPDGKEQPFTVNSHQFNMKLMPFKDMIELGRKAASDARAERKDDAMIGYYEAGTTKRIADAKHTDRKGTGKPGGGTGAAGRVHAVKTDADGNMVAILKDGTVRPLGVKAGDFNKQVAGIVKQMADKDFEFRQLPEEEKRQRAVQRLTGGAGQPAAPSGAPTKDYSNLWK